jgi:apolipoprotein D and lipocalin family protein
MYVCLGLILVVAAVIALSKGPRYQGNRIYAGTLDLDRYVGRWHQLLEAKNDNAWLFSLVEGVSASCYGVVVDYVREGDRIRLVNRCREGGFDGREVAISGLATPVNFANTKFKIRFDPWYLRWASFDYWIVDVDPEYQMSVLSAPDSMGVTILSRTPAPDPALYGRALNIARALGYDPNKSRVTPQLPNVQR